MASELSTALAGESLVAAIQCKLKGAGELTLFSPESLTLLATLVDSEANFVRCVERAWTGWT